MSKISEMFIGWFDYPEEEFVEILNNAHISLDTNVLLNLYRYSKQNSQETLSLLNTVKKRLIFSHYVTLEYVKNRKKVAADSIEEYKKIISSIDEKYNSLLGELNNISSNKLSKKDKLIDSIQKNQLKIITAIESEKTKKDELYKSGLEAEICELIGDSILEKFSDADYIKNKAEGIRRFKEQIPPGFMDSDKNENGDYYIFKSLIDFAIEKESDVIFVTDDVKKDMFVNLHGIKYARPELLNEFYELTGKKILIMTLQDFLKNKIIFKNDVSSSLLDEIKTMSLENHSFNIRTYTRIRKFLYRAFKYDTIEDLEKNVDNIKKALRTIMRISEGFNDYKIIADYDLLMNLLDQGDYDKFIDISKPQREKIIKLKNTELDKINSMYSVLNILSEQEDKIKFIELLIAYIDEYLIDDYDSKSYIVKLRELSRSIRYDYIDSINLSSELGMAYRFAIESGKYVSL